MDENQHEALQSKPWGPWATAGFSLIISAVYFVLGVLAVAGMIAYETLRKPQLDAFTHADVLADNGLLLSIGSIATFVICSGLILLFTGIRKQITIKAYLLLKRVPIPVLARWIAVALIIAFGWDAVNLLIGRPIVPEFMINAYRTAVIMPLFWFAIVVAAPLLEELFFRGFLFSGLERSKIGIAGTIAVTAVIWAAIHAQYELPELFWIFFMGIFMGIARVRTRSIYAPIAMHMTLNLAATVETAHFVASNAAVL
jgi:membrane protease YdiL (CAAX protease family)